MANHKSSCMFPCSLRCWRFPLMMSRSRSTILQLMCGKVHMTVTLRLFSCYTCISPPGMSSTSLSPLPRHVLEHPTSVCGLRSGRHTRGSSNSFGKSESRTMAISDVLSLVSAKGISILILQCKVCLPFQHEYESALYCIGGEAGPL